MPQKRQPFLASLTDRLIDTEEFDTIRVALNQTKANVPTICPEPANPLLIAALWRALRVPTLVVTPNPDSAQRIVDQLPTWLGTPDIDEEGSIVHHFIESGGIPFERYEPDRGTGHQRITTLDALRNHTNLDSDPPLVVASVHAVAERTIEASNFDDIVRELRAGDRIDLSETMRHLTNSGYEVQPTVELPGTASRRGGIIDIFPVGTIHPVRIELFDDEIESIRLFDVESQRSFKDIESVRIVPAREELPTFVDRQAIQNDIGDLNTDNIDFTRLSGHRVSDELNLVADGVIENELAFYSGFFNRGSLFDFMPNGSALVALRPRMIADAATGIDRRLDEIRRVKERRGEVPINFPTPHMQWPEVAHGIESFGRRTEIDPFGIDTRDLGNKLPLPIRTLMTVSRSEISAPDDDSGEQVEVVLDDPTQALKKAIGEGANQVVAISSHSIRLYELAQEADIPIQYERQGRATGNSEESTEKVVIAEGYATSRLLHSGTGRR